LKGDLLTREEAIEALQLLLMIPVNDMKQMFECIEQKDWKKLRQVIKKIRERKAKYGI